MTKNTFTLRHKLAFAHFGELETLMHYEEVHSIRCMHADVCKVHGDIFSGILINLQSLILDAKRCVYNLDHS